MLSVALLSVALAAGFAYLLAIAPVGCAYKAKVLCSALFVSGLEVDLERAPEIADDAYKILRLFRARVDRAERSVTCSFLGLRSRTAVYRRGLGATVLSGALWQPEAPVEDPPGGADPCPAPAPESGKLKNWLDDCFPEKNPERLRRTRAVLVLHDGKLVADRYAPGFSRETRLTGWSMTKAVVGALVGVLVRDGRLSLSEKNLLPEWRGTGDPRAEISLDDMLRMRSGLRFEELYGKPLSDVNRMLWLSRDMGAYAAARPLAHPPGSRWKYASGTTNILAKIIRNVVGERDYPRFPRRALFEPLGMRSALVEMDSAGNFVGSSHMFATARDWARFGRLYAQGGVWDGRRVLPEGWVELAATPTPQSDGRYGAHWWLKLPKELGGETEAAKKIPADAFYALGHEDQSVTVIPSKKLVVVRLGLSIYIDAWNHAQFIADLLDVLG